ncbi:unnamed protein product [Adineta steineri]|uniref:Uncharacterized protein n=1 Tax=Adineta steineri TaxID=433720 RepID=A0A814FMA5_9BILA|nr:unnamed protein product [Adineta steineri]
MQCFQWCWRKLHRNRYANKMHYEEQSQCFKMIPINDDVDHAWSEFERYSTNGYIRQLLDDQATALVKGTTTDVTSESSSSNADELKRIKTLVIDIQTRFVQMETRCDRWITDMKEFGYVLFLLFFSYYMLFAFFPLSQDNRSLIGKIRSYFDLNNRISNLFLVLPAYLLFYIGLALRFTQKSPQGFLSARIVMALDLELAFIRSVLFIGIASDLGPKIVMIRKMTNDFILFIVVIVIFIFGYGVSSRSMTAYGTIDFKGQNSFRAIVHPVYYFVHGSIDNERTQLDATPDSGGTIVTQIIFAFHMLCSGIFTINDIQTQARYVWAYDRCDIIRTYYARPALFPPFTFLISIMQCFQWCWKKLYRNRNGKEEQSQCFKMIPINDDVDHAWLEFERYSTNGYIRQLLDDQATALVKGTTTDVTSESSSNNADELKRIKTLVTDIQTRFVQMETRCDRWITDMKEARTSSISQKRHQQLNKEYTTAGHPLLQQERSVTSEVRIEMTLRKNNNNDV